MTVALGAFAFATEPSASDPLHDPPVVTITAPTGTVTTGGPDLTAQWTFTQAQSDEQEWYRVLLTNDGGTTTYYDSGWLSGTAASLAVDIDAEEVPADTTDLTVQVQARGPEAIGTGTVARYQTSDTEAIELQYGVPHCTITAPVDGAIWADADSVNVEWTFVDDRAGKTQGWYRIRLFSAGTGLLLVSTGWTASAVTSRDVDYYLQDGSIVDVEVQLKNNEGIRSD